GVVDASVSQLLNEEVFTPARFQTREQNRGNNYIAMLARLGEGVTAAQLQAQLATLNERWVREYPENHAGMTLQVRGLLAHQTRQVSGMLWLLQGAVLLLLAVACANVANLALARLASRQRELATEVALGANAGRLLRASVSEALLLCIAGLLLGLLLSQWLLELLRWWAPAGLPRLETLQIGWPAWSMALATTAMAVLLAGVVPGWAAARIARSGQRHGLRQDGGGAMRANWRRALVAGQLGLSTVLLVGCLLVLQHLSQLAEVDTGFRSEGLLSAEIVLPASSRSDQYETMQADSQTNRRFLDQLLPQLAALPGVTSIAAIDQPPLSGESNASGEVTVVGRDYANGQPPTVEWRWITPGYFDTAGVSLLRGRPANPDPAARETVINATLASNEFGQTDPIGEQLNWWGQAMTIVGVASDTRQWSLGRPASAEMYLYVGQVPAPATTTLLLRTAGDPLLLAEPLRQ
ncbi:MAG: ABC transporter permease, partial [Xanthomonadales bacterium]|nr:ABC transporter permease [Xanthomonadales bacterium]